MSNEHKNSDVYSTRIYLPHMKDDKGIEFVELLTQHQRSLYGYIYTMVRNSSDSDDLLQETNVVLWNKRLEYKTGTNFTAWACRIAYYKVQNFLRSKGRSRICFSDKLLSKLSDLHIKRDEMHTIQTTLLVYCLEKLSVASQQLLKLCFDETHSIQDVARQLGRPVGSIYNQLSQIRFKLWKCIQFALKEEA